MRVNAELNKQVRDLQAEAVDLRAENARLCSAHQSTQARLENTLKQLEHHQKSDRLMKALQLISSTADQALLDFQDQESERPHSSNSSFNFDADTILPSASNSLKASRQDSRPPLISTKPDLSLIDEASHEESFYRQSVQQQQQQYQQQQRFEDGPPLLPPSVVFTRPRRSSSAASLRPMLDEVQEVSERSPSTSPTSSPSAPSKLDTNASLTALDPKVAVRRRSLFQPTPQPPKEDSSTSSRSRSTSPEPSSKPTSHHSGLDRAVEGLTLADVELDKPDVLPRRKRNLSQPHATSTATSRPTSAASREKESTNAGSSTISSRARSRTPSLSRSASTSNIREAASSPHDVEKQPTIRKRRSSSSLAAASTTGKSSGSLIVRTRIEASTSTPSTRTPSSQEFGPGAEVEKALDRITTLSRRSSISNVPPTRRAVSAPRPRELSPALGPESPMLDDEDDAPAMTPPPEVDMDGLLVKRRLPTSRSDEMQTLTEENESIHRRSTSTLASSASSSKLSFDRPPSSQSSNPTTSQEEEEAEGTGSRRARKSVNYALPNLRDKMRQPEGYVPAIKKAPSGPGSHQHPSSGRSSTSSKGDASDEVYDRTALGDASNSLTLPRRKSSAQLGGSKEDAPPTSTGSLRGRSNRLSSS